MSPYSKGVFQMGKYKLSDVELRRFNNDLKDLEDILDDLKQAKEAGVPNVDYIEQACQACKERIHKLKSIYAKGKK